MSNIKMFSLVVILACLTQGDLTSSAQSTANLNQNSYFIQGAVKNPGVYQIESFPSALKLITLAGGLSDTYGPTAFIIRRAGSQTDATESEINFGRGHKLICIDVLGLLKGKFQKDAVLEAGDILNIPPNEVFFVAGEVNRMSMFPIREGMTLRQATSLAHGVNSSAQIEEVIIFRSDPASGKREEIKVNEVMSGKAIDVLIKANDVIVVPKRPN
jgi:polysaccharide export outer membrane protein